MTVDEMNAKYGKPAVTATPQIKSVPSVLEQAWSGGVPKSVPESPTFLGYKQGEESVPAETARAISSTIQSQGQKMAEEPSIVGKTAVALESPLKVGADVARGVVKAAEPIMKPISKAISAGADILQKTLPKDTLNEIGIELQTAGKNIESLKDKVGSEVFQSLKDTFDLLSTFYVGGKGATLTTKTAEATKSVVENIVKTGTEALVNAGVKTAEVIAPKTKGLSESIIANINRLNPLKRKEFVAQQGISAEKWLIERGIVGTREKTIEELANRFKTLRENVDNALDKIPGQYKDSRITIVADEAAEFAAQTESKLSGRIAELANKAKNEGLTTSEINEVKRFYERNIKTGYKKDATKTSEQIQRATNRDSGIRESLLEIADKNGFTNLREINKEIQASKFLGDEIAGKMEGQGANNLMTLTDWIAITPGAIDPTFLSGFVTKKLLSTETARAFAAKALAGFPKVKTMPLADLDEITKRATELFKKIETAKAETTQAALLADELQKSGFTMSEGVKGFITENPIPLSRNEQALIKAAKNQAEQEQIVKYILEQRSQGKAVGEGFTIQDIDNIPILNPQERFNPNKMLPDIK